MSHESNMHAGGESDGRVVPTKCPNNGEQSLAEGVEGRQSTKENIEQATAPRTQSRNSVSQRLGGVREAARKDKRTAVHRAAAPRNDGSASGQLLLAEAGGRAGSGRSDVGGV